MSTHTTSQEISVSRQIAAPAAVIFGILADPARHSEIDGSGTVNRAASGAPERLAMGTKFGMKMKLAFLPYGMRNTVVEFTENRLIAWAHIGKHRWRYELEPNGDRTLVTETFDWSTALAPWLIKALGYPKKHEFTMATTLEQLDAIALAEAAAQT